MQTAVSEIGDVCKRLAHTAADGDPFENEVTAHLRTTAAWSIEAVRRRTHRRRRRRGAWPSEFELTTKLWSHTRNLLCVRRELAIDEAAIGPRLLRICRRAAVQALGDEQSNEAIGARDRQ